MSLLRNVRLASPRLGKTRRRSRRKLLGGFSLFLSAVRVRPKRRRGYSFLEVLFAVFLLGCSATIVTAAMPAATRSRTKADQANRAAALAQREMESVRGLGYANLTATQLGANALVDSTNPDGDGGLPWTNVDAGRADAVSAALSGGTGEIWIAQEDIELRRVTVTVSWNERGRARTYSLSTLVANL